MLAERIKADDTVWLPVQCCSVGARVLLSFFVVFSAAMVSLSNRLKLNMWKTTNPPISSFCAFGPPPPPPLLQYTLQSGTYDPAAAAQHRSLVRLVFMCPDPIRFDVWIFVVQEARGMRLWLRLLCMW